MLSALRRAPRLVLALVLALLLGAAALVWWPRAHAFAVSADFVDTTGLYVGNEVQYLGVPVGKITAIRMRGPVMRVEMRVDAGTKVPRKAVAEILQSSLLTDRYVELGPVYRGGPALAAGAHIDADRTRSPISFDDLGRSIDQLVVALGRHGPDGRDVGDLVSVTAADLRGNGGRIGRLLIAGRDALSAVNSKAPDLRAIAGDLDVIVRLLAERDGLVRRLTTNMTTASSVVAGQTRSLDETLRSLSRLSTEVGDFVARNHTRLQANLRDASRVAHTIRQQQSRLSHIFDYLPTGAENIARAYDPKARAIRVELAGRDMAVFNQLVRAEFCHAFATPRMCAVFTNAQGTGIFDQLFDAVAGAIPGSY